MSLAVTTSTIVLTAWLTPALQANTITGSIGFNSLGPVTLIGGTDLASATSFSLTDPVVSTDSGTYGVVPTQTPVTFNGFEFNPAVASVTPLWTFTYNGLTYTFDATSVSSYYNSVLQQWDIGGSGVAMVTGYASQTGTWNVNLSQSGATVVFDSSAGVPATAADSGSTLLLLGGGFVGMAGIGRKFKC